MHTPPTSLLPLLTAAVDLRAAGVSWAKVAEHVKRDAETCRAWPRRYAETWRRLYREAEGQFIAEAGIEARTCLRLLLRDENPKVVLGAAKLLLQGRESQQDREDRLERPEPERVSAEIVEFLRSLKGMTDGQLDDLVKAFMARRAGLSDAEEGGESPPQPSAGPAFGFSFVDAPPVCDIFAECQG